MPEYTAKDIRVAPIKSADANALVKRVHYSGKVVQNSQLHLGVFLGNRLEGVMQFGPSLDKRKMLGLVEGTSWNGFIELNRMAFSDALPRNSESRAIAVAMRLIRQHYPHIEWVVSFADGTQCGDGTIYRASGFVLTGIVSSVNLVKRADGVVIHKMTLESNPTSPRPELGGRSYYAITGGRYNLAAYAKATGGVTLPGYQLRYIYFINPAARERLTVQILPFSKIDDMGAGMYRGKSITRAKRQEPEYPSGLGGSTPTGTLHPSASEAGESADQADSGGATPTRTLQT
jgi:hypothetical protein